MDHDERMNVRVTLEGRVWMRAVTGGMASWGHDTIIIYIGYFQTQ